MILVHIVQIRLASVLKWFVNGSVIDLTHKLVEMHFDPFKEGVFFKSS